MSLKKRFAALAAFTCLSLLCGAVQAQERPYTEGAILVISSVRTEYGKFDDYMKFLSTKWKQMQETAKKSGQILDYAIYQAQPHGPDDPDLYLVITYKNWAALDGLSDKQDALMKQIYGSVTASGQAAVERGNMRRMLGSQTIQQLVLK